MAEWKPEEHLQNADLNLNQYWDDSTPANQVSTPWGMNNKYTGEWTLNSNIPYNANIRTSDLDPNYVYGWDAQLANSKDAGYIARRNDNIASALYNEGLRSKEDVISFLWSQKNWNNSTESDRFNTVESVWKRIWDIAEQNDKDKTEVEVKEMEAEKKEEPKWQDVNVNTFLQWSTTELFGKMITWADTAPYDHNSTEWKKAEARLAQYQRVNALSVPQLASSIKAWSILLWWQAMRDLQTYNPEKYQQLQEYQKKEDTMSTVNMIASGNFTNDQQWLQDKTWSSINNYLNETVANAGWDSTSRMDLDKALSQNQWIINYAERMSYYASQINQLDQTIWDLEEEARKRLSATTWENVPEYMIQNYINNRSKKLYKQRDNLMNQYNYYKWVYEAQVEQEATEWERAYKERQMQLQEDKFAWDKKMDQAGMDYKYDVLNQNNLQDTYKGLKTYTESWMKGKWLKNNNPWNIKDTTFWYVIGTDASWFAIFETPEDGFDALVEKIKFNQTNPSSKYYGKTIAEYFKLYAPDSDGNNSSAYANSVAKQLWVSVNTPISKLDPVKFASVIAKHDSGYDYSTYGKFRGNDGNIWELYTQLKNWTLTYSNYIKKLWSDMTQDEKNVEIIKQAMNDVKNWKDMQNTFNWLRKLSASNFFTGEMAQNTRYEMLNALSESNKSNKDIMKIVKAWNDELWDDDDKLWDRLSIALAWRYTDVDQLDKDLDVIWYKDKWYTTNKAKKIWNIWKEDGII